MTYPSIYCPNKNINNIFMFRGLYLNISKFTFITFFETSLLIFSSMLFWVSGPFKFQIVSTNLVACSEWICWSNLFRLKWALFIHFCSQVLDSKHLLASLLWYSQQERKAKTESMQRWHSHCFSVNLGTFPAI